MRYFSGVYIALGTGFLASTYTIISIVTVLERFDEFGGFGNYHHISQPLNISTKTRMHSDSIFHASTMSQNASMTDFSGKLENVDEISPPQMVVQAIQKHHSLVSLNTSRTSHDSENGTNPFDLSDTMERERLRVLDTLIGHYSNLSAAIVSDVVELRHCNLGIIDYSTFSSWASVILRDAWPKIQKKQKQNAIEVQGLRRKDDWDDDMYREFCIGLLEVFATHNNGGEIGAVCDFEKYSLSIEGVDLLPAELKLRKVPLSYIGLPRLVFVIVAFQDAQHLEVLVEACYMPHHLIVVHLERRSPPLFTESIFRIAKKYANVAVVQFGSIIYQTDSVSTVNYRIMNWLTEELQIPYDYLLTLGNAVYPLYGAEELTKYFLNTERQIWLGALRNNNNGGWRSSAYLERKRLIYTIGKQKYTQRTKKWKQNGFDSPLPGYITENMTGKTNSGNQAVFSHKVVKDLVTSPHVKELFSIAKYGCCCCLEERTWVAAAKLIGHGVEAMEGASMFQVWGGETTCGEGTMKNALLRSNSTICYKSQDLTKGNVVERRKNNSHHTNTPEDPFFRGDELFDELRRAKERGFLFARKFNSKNPDSRELIQIIKNEIHNK